MAHTFSTSMFSVPARCVKSRFASLGSVIGRSVMALLVFALVLVSGLSSQAQTASSYVPPIVVSSVGTVPTTVFTKTAETGLETNVVQPILLALDACGNIYVQDKGGDGYGSQLNGQFATGTLYTEIPAGGGTATVVQNVGQGFPTNMGQDPIDANLILGASYNNHVNEVPLVGCVPQTSTIKSVGGQGPGALFYYYLEQTAAGDFQGNTYIATQNTCCITGKFYLIKSIGGGESEILLANQATVITSLAVDMQQNVYLVTGGILYVLQYNPNSTAQPYASTPVPFGSFNDPTGLTVDKNGNLYVADIGTSSIYEIPYELTPGSSPAAYALNIADQFVVSSGIKPDAPPAVSARGDVYFIDQKQQNVSELTLGYANFNSVPVGTTATRTVNFQFNASVTPSSIQLPTGVFSSATAAVGTTPCASTAYGPSGTTSCQVTIAFTPTAVGRQTSAIVLADAKGNPLATANLVGVGQGPLITIDPGTISTLGSGLKGPAGVAIDHAGNTFIADAVNNVITEIPAGGGAAVNLAVTASTTPISGALGVGVDGAGNLFIADTGNNRILEVPYINGAYSPASISNATVVASGLKSPSGIFVNGNGDLYVADTGDNTIAYYPNTGVTFGTVQNIGTGLNAPLAVTADPAGDLFIADSGNNQIVELPNGAGQETVYANILNPSALATDSSNALFAVDQGNLRVLRIPSVNGALNTNSVAEVTLGVANPYGIALDSSANLYVTDQKNAAAYTLARSQIALSFGDLAVGTSSGPLPLTVESSGNQPLVFGTPYFTETGNSGDFAMTSPTGACADGVTLAAGTSCDLVTDFTPSASGSRSATISFSANDAVPANVTLTGNGVAAAPTTTKLAVSTAVAGAPFFGEPLNIVATVTPAGSTAPTGNVSFIVDGVQAGLFPLVSGVATLPLNSGLTGGAHTIYAVYKGDSANNGSASASLAISIARAPTTTTLAVTNIPFNNPYSLRHSNPGSCDVLGAIRNVEFGFPALTTDSVSFKSGVSSPGVGVPSGTLTFYSDGKLINGPPVLVTATDPTPKQPPTSVATLLPAPGGTYTGDMTSNADTLGDGDFFGENNVLLGTHNITVVYSGDSNYLPSTSIVTQITVVDVSATTPVTLPNAVVGIAPYCTSTSPITTSAPSVPGTYTVGASTNTIPVSANAPGQAVLTISSLGSWGGTGDGGTISFSCPNLPKYTTCTTNPGVATVFASTPGATRLPTQVTLTITTNVPPSIPTAAQSGFLWPAATLLGLALLAMRRRVKRIQTGIALFGVALLFFGGMAGLSSCGAGTQNQPGVVTPAGSYPITVVMTGAQPSANYQQPGANNGDDEETMKPDLPYSLPFTLVVK